MYFLEIGIYFENCEVRVNGNRRLRCALRVLRERNVKRDIKLKLVRNVLDVVKDGLAVLEKLPKRFQDRVIEKNKVLNSIDVHRLKQSSIRGIHKIVTEKLAEHRIHDPRVKWSVTAVKCGAEVQPVLARPTIT